MKQEEGTKDKKLSAAQLQAIHRFEKLYRLVSVLVCALMMVVLLITVSYLPPFGDPGNPANNEVPARYIEKGLQETGAMNVVAGMILDYRAFDTFGESTVLFLAVCSIMMVLKKSPDEVLVNTLNTRPYEPRQDQIFRWIALYLIPCIMLFGIYVVLNGHLSPGGGFSGGAILGAGFIMYCSAFGFEKTSAFLNEQTFKKVVSCALLFYAAAKSYSFYTGANHIASIIPLGKPGAILSGGLILPLNIAVGMIVACTVYGIFALYSRGGF
jgi:multisubunit Na+/H+ antiporter MnhB subunit